MSTTEAQAPEVGVEFTDAHLAEVVVQEQLRGAFCWATGLGWLRWDGARWQSTTDRKVRDEVRRWAVRHFQEAGLEAAEALRRGDQATARAQEALTVGWRRTCASGRLNAIVGLASGIEHQDGAEFDQQPDLLNCRNGVVDLHTGDLRPHDPDLLFTKVTGVDYDPTATHPDWTKALEALPPGMVQNWMQIRIGQAATGHAPDDDMIPICQGGGKNGKSTVFTGIAHALGDFHTLVSDRVLLGNPGDHPTELMDLRGARFALIEETPEARKLDVQRMKKITGTAAITARKIAQDSVTFPVTHSLFVTSNHRPMVDQTDFGTWRRLALVRFPYTFSGDSADPSLRDRVRRGAAVHRAVLAWIVRGARAWYENGRVTPGKPQQVVSDTRDWRAGSDLVLAYWQDRLIPDQGSHIIATELFADFNDWLTGRGQREWGDRTFVDRFADHEETEGSGVERTKIRARAGLSRPPGYDSNPVVAQYHAWLGLRFRTPADVLKQGPGTAGTPFPVAPLEIPSREHSPSLPSQPSQALGDDLEQAS